MEKLLLTPNEAAAMLSVSRSKIYELLSARKLGSVRLDGCRRIPVHELRAYVARLAGNEADQETAA